MLVIFYKNFFLAISFAHSAHTMWMVKGNFRIKSWLGLVCARYLKPFGFGYNFCYNLFFARACFNIFTFVHMQKRCTQVEKLMVREKNAFSVPQKGYVKYFFFFKFLTVSLCVSLIHCLHYNTQNNSFYRNSIMYTIYS